MKKSYLRKSQNPERPAYFRFSEFAAANALQGQTGAPPAMSRKKCAPKTAAKFRQTSQFSAAPLFPVCEPHISAPCRASGKFVKKNG